MAFTYVQGTGHQNASGGGSTATTCAATFTGAVTAGDLIVVFVNNYNAGTVTVADNVNSGNYTAGPAVTTASHSWCLSFYRVIPAGAAAGAFTVTMTSTSAGYPSISCDEYSSPNLSALTIDASGTNHANAGVSATATLTSSLVPTSSDLIVFSASTLSTVSESGSNLTLTYNKPNVSGEAMGITTGYLATQTSSINPEVTFSASSDWACVGIAFSVGLGPISTCYVSSSGGNSNTGISTSSPWLTIAFALSQVSFPATINLNGGNTFTENPNLTSSVTIQSYGTGQATIAGTTSSAVTITNCSGVTLSNLILTQNTTTGTSGTYTGIVNLVENTGTRYTGGVTITGCTISGGPNGITSQCASANNGGWNGITISNNTITNCSEFGIYLHEVGSTGTNVHHSAVTITGNTIYDIFGDSTTGASGCGIVLGNADSTTGTGAAQCVISSNLIYGCGQFCTSSDGPAGIFPIYATGVLIEYNVVHGMYMSTANEDGDGIDVDISCTNTTVQYNYTYSNQGPGFNIITADSGTVIRFNLSVNDGNVHLGSAFVATGVPGLQFYNNTIIAQGTNPALVGQTITGCTFYNNIFVSASSVASVSISSIGTGCDFEGNAYLSGTGFLCDSPTVCTSLAAWRTATGLETSPHGFAVPINFLGPSTPLAITPSQLSTCNNYQLMPGSPLLAAGLNLNSLYSINPGTVDFLGATLSTPYSVGAINAAFAFGLFIFGDQIQEIFG